LLPAEETGQGTFSGHHILAKTEKNRHPAVFYDDFALDFFSLCEPVSEDAVSADLLLRLLDDGFDLFEDLLA
jgi:hypothetical protein